MVDKVQETAGRLAGMGQDSGGSQGGQSGSMTDQVAEQVTEQVTSRLDMGKEYLVEAMTGVAHALRQTGQHLREEGAQPTLAQYVDRGAEQIERIGGHMRQRAANELLTEVEGFARRQPMVFAGGAFALGMLAVRFLRSSGQRQQQTSSSYSASSSGAAPSSYRTTGGASPTSSSAPPSYGSAGATTPSTMPGSQPLVTSAGSADRSGTGPVMNPGTPAAPGRYSGSPSEQVTPRHVAAPSVGGTTPGAGTTAPRSSSGTQSGGQPRNDAPGSGRTGTGNRNQP
jgi:hypothetical protein